MDLLVLITQYSFQIAMLGMAGATAYLWLERDSIASEYRAAATVAGIYTAVAAYMYWQMAQTVGLSGDIQDVLALPTHVRYIDWIITTPLILLTIAIILDIPSKRAGLVWIVIAADIAMIVFGYFGELFADRPGKEFEAWTLFGLGCLAYLFLLYLVLGFFRDTAEDKVEPVQRAFKFMALFVAVGWTVYPIGFVFGMADSDTLKITRELIYNVADVVNKVGLALVAVFAARAISRDSRIRSAMRDLQAE
ncbi:MAG: bacteriorhodopsin [Candidatus Wenzhouxiangella sp. M2_3B_020]